MPDSERSRSTDLHYSTASEAAAHLALTYLIGGRGLGPAYCEFIANRARWLSLSGYATTRPDGRVEIVAAGPEALVGALEMACLLGPLDAFVDSIEASPLEGPVGCGFSLR